MYLRGDAPWAQDVLVDKSAASPQPGVLFDAAMLRLYCKADGGLAHFPSDGIAFGRMLGFSPRELNDAQARLLFETFIGEGIITRRGQATQLDPQELALWICEAQRAAGASKKKIPVDEAAEKQRASKRAWWAANGARKRPPKTRQIANALDRPSERPAR